MKQSNWMKGLLYAELLGAEKAVEFIRSYDSMDCDYSFLAGMHDYVKHARTRLGQ